MNNFTRTLFILFCFNYTIAKLTFLSTTNSTPNNVINCATEISIKNFNLRKPTIVFSKDVEGKFIDSYLKSYTGTVVIETKGNGAAGGQVVLIIDSVKSFMKILGKLKPDLKGKSLLKSGAKFLILVLGNPHKFGRITKIFWSYHAINTVIVINDKKGNVNMYTYFPYKNNLICHNTEPSQMGVWKEGALKQNMYPDKMANMRGCPLYISSNKLYYKNSEQNIPLQILKKTMIRLLRDIMNFTPVIYAKDYVSIDSKRAQNWSESLNEIVTGVVNISICSVSSGIAGLGALDYSVPYFRVQLAWLAPPVTPGAVWWRLLSPLNGYLWLILLLVLFIVTFLPFALKLRSVKNFCFRYFKNIKKLRGVAIRIWGVMLGQPIRVVPRRFRDFYIISIWIWFAFVIRSVYQSVLIGALKTDTFVGDFTDLEEAIHNGYKFGGKAGILAHFEHDPMIRKGFEVIPDEKYENIFHDVIEGRVKFVVAASLEYAWAYCLSQGKKENECGHVLPDTIMTVPLVIWMRIHSPFLRPITNWLPRLIESGLLEKDAIQKPYSGTIQTDPSPLTRHQTLSCVICLLLGFTLSIVVFILEILRNKTKILKHRLVEKAKRQMSRKKTKDCLKLRNFKA